MIVPPDSASLDSERVERWRGALSWGEYPASPGTLGWESETNLIIAAMAFADAEAEPRVSSEVRSLVTKATDADLAEPYLAPECGYCLQTDDGEGRVVAIDIRSYDDAEMLRQGWNRLRAEAGCLPTSSTIRGKATL